MEYYELKGQWKYPFKTRISLLINQGLPPAPCLTPFAQLLD